MISSACFRFFVPDDFSRPGLHQAAIKLLNILNGCVARVSGTACISICRLCKCLNVLFLNNTLKSRNDSYILGELTYSVNCCLAVLLLSHLVDTLNTHCDSDVAVLCAGVISVVSHNGRKQNCASLAVRHIVVCGKGVSHRVVNAEPIPATY